MLSIAMMILGFGMGMAGPGFMAGASLAVSPQEQGSVAGVAGSCGPLGFTLGPLLGGALYQINGALPYAVAAGDVSAAVRLDALDRQARVRCTTRAPEVAWRAGCVRRRTDRRAKLRTFVNATDRRASQREASADARTRSNDLDAHVIPRSRGDRFRCGLGRHGADVSKPQVRAEMADDGRGARR